MGLYGDISELDSVSSSNLLDEKLIFVRLRVAAPYFMMHTVVGYRKQCHAFGTLETLLGGQFTSSI